MSLKFSVKCSQAEYSTLVYVIGSHTRRNEIAWKRTWILFRASVSITFRTHPFVHLHSAWAFGFVAYSDWIDSPL